MLLIFENGCGQQVACCQPVTCCPEASGSPINKKEFVAAPKFRGQPEKSLNSTAGLSAVRVSPKL
jgi:hypothetical protein